MSRDKDKSVHLARLRERAEAVLKRDPPDVPDVVSGDVRELVHDLQTHQIELEMQNEELRRAQVELAESRDRYSDLYDFAPVGYLTVGEKGIILQANLTLTEMLGVERGRLVNRPLSAFVLADDQDAYYGHHRDLLASTVRESCEVRMRKDGGEPFWASMNGVVMEDAEGKGLQIQLAVSCIDERKQLEGDRERLIADLEAKNAELEQFTDIVSHDLKSPLITVNGFLCLLKEDLAKGEADAVADHMERITAATVRMQQFIDGLLELSRIGRIANPSQQVPLAVAAREALELLPTDGIRIEISGDLPIVSFDPMRLRQVIQNLVENAVKFMGDQSDPRITVGVRRDGTESVIFVRDNGIGIEPCHHRRIFGLFETLDRTNHGVGIGLALVKRIVEVYHGRIWVESEGIGKGTTFCFTAPPGQTPTVRDAGLFQGRDAERKGSERQL